MDKHKTIKYQLTLASIILMLCMAGIASAIDVTIQGTVKFLDPDINQTMPYSSTSGAYTTQGTVERAENMTGMLSASDSRAISPTASSFSASNESTNFSGVADLFAVNGLTLATSNGKIRFPASHAVNADNQDYDSNVVIGPRFVSVNTANLHSTFNSSSNITIEDVDCSGYIIYYGEGTFTADSEIKALNQPCPGSICHDFSCADGGLTFMVAHFTGYAIGDNANLTIYDEIEAGGMKYTDTAIMFYANYTNISSGAHIASATCQISFDDGTGPFSMTDAGTQYTYSKTTGFSSEGDHEWNVTCAKSGYNTLNATDDIYITSASAAIPEFGTTGIVMIIMTIAAGLAIFRKNRQG